MKLIVALLAVVLAGPLLAEGPDRKLQGIVDDEARPAEERERDRYRNPYETLVFFGIRPDMTVVEISPGGGWYTEILGPYLAAEGKLRAAHFNLDREDAPGYFEPARESYDERIADRERFGDIEVFAFDPPELSSLGEPGSADMVLTFRNVHGYKRAGTLEQVFESAYEVLRSGGVFGVVGHRLPEDAEQDPEARSGYIKESVIVEYAESVGFELEASSDINENPKDTADHPNGVWTLPPSLRVPDDEDEAKYRKIGESDRFTLKFVKP